MRWILLLGWMLFPRMVLAHPLDVAYLDFSVVSSTPRLTVAVHPYQAFELVRSDEKMHFSIAGLEAKKDLVGAYIEDHLTLKQGDTACRWSGDEMVVPSTELEAVADGVTVAGNIQCPKMEDVPLTVATDVFMERFPAQTAIVRFELPDGFAERKTLNSKERSFSFSLLDLRKEMQTETTLPSIGTVEPKGFSLSPRLDLVSRVDQVAALAQRALDPKLSWWSLVLLLGAVALVGVLHALGPGHGKSLLAAVLVGEKATFGRAFILTVVMTLTHVSDVFVMALLAGFVSSFLTMSTIFRWLEIGSSVGLVVLGSLSLVRAMRRYRSVRRNPELGAGDEAHARAHALGMPHTHEPAGGEGSFRQALWLGFMGSIAPCPTAWVIFMATLSAGRPVMGFALLLAFTLGLSLTILGIGILLVVSKRFALRRSSERWVYFFPILSAAVIVGLGVVFLVRVFVL